jgi:hypothetical protein
MVLGRAPDGFARRRAADDIGNWAAALSDDLSEPCEEVIRLTMHPIAERRIALDRLLEHAWVRNGIPRAPGEAREIIETARAGGRRIRERQILAEVREEGIVQILAAPVDRPSRLRGKKERGRRRPATAVAMRRRSVVLRPMRPRNATGFR